MDEERKKCLTLLNDFYKVKESKNFIVYRNACRAFIDAACSYFIQYGAPDDSAIIRGNFFHDMCAKLIDAKSSLIYSHEYPEQKNIFIREYWNAIDSLETDIETLRKELDKEIE